MQYEADQFDETINNLAAAVWGTFQSTNELDANWEPANVVDALVSISRALGRIADALVERNALASEEGRR
jgi:hypothetical protein